jgi:hypothetical protein
MASSAFDRIADPLVDRFSLDDLPRIAPWVAEEIRLVGVDAVRDYIGRRGDDPDAAQPMTAWIAALRSCSGPMWEALDVA